MKKFNPSVRLVLVMSFILTGILLQNVSGQAVVGLDNWFNRETNAKTGKPFHYLWTDTEWSGYSRWGQIFESRGAQLKTIENPDAS